jgi:hypothetical protein
MDDDVTFEEMCADYEAMDDKEYEQVMAELDASNARQND